MGQVIGAINAIWGIVKLIRSLFDMWGDYCRLKKQRELDAHIEELKKQGKTDAEIARILGDIVRDSF